MRKFLVVVVALMLLLTACSGQKSANDAKPADSKAAAPAAAPAKAPVPGVTDTEIVLGNTMAYSGPAGFVGTLGYGYEAYFQYINDTEGGVNGRKIKFVMEDDQLDPVKTIAATKKLVEQTKVFALVGSVNASMVYDYIGQQKIPLFAAIDEADNSYDPLKPMIYEGNMGLRAQSAIMIKFLTNIAKGKKMAIFNQNDAFGNAVADQLKGLAAQAGVQVVATIPHEVTETNFSSYALKLKQSGAEVVGLASGAGFDAPLLKEAEKIGYKPIWIGGTAVNDTNLITLAGSAAEGVYAVSYYPDPADPTLANDPMVKAYKQYMAKNKHDETKWGLAAFEFGKITVDILKRAGKDLTRESALDAANKTNWNGAFPTIYTATDHRGPTVGWVEQVKGGKFVKVSDKIDGRP